MPNTITISKQRLREIILDVIDEGDEGSPWRLFADDSPITSIGISEARANAQRLDFCDAIQSKLDEERL